MSMDELEIERVAALACGRTGEANCRHEWNRLHPEDLITEEDQKAFEDRIMAARWT